MYVCVVFTQLSLLKKNMVADSQYFFSILSSFHQKQFPFYVIKTAALTFKAQKKVSFFSIG
jgi:hypothetical protein